MRPTHLAACVAVLFLLSPGRGHAHCEIPCGIYGDKTRIDLLYEHVATVERSMRQIQELSGKTDAQSANQLTRWVANKERHAQEIQHIVTQYFMTQRVKPADPKQEEAHRRYLTQLTTLHAMLLAAMKCKQTVDTAHCDRLRVLIDRFAGAYFSGEDLRHIREEHGKHGKDEKEKK